MGLSYVHAKLKSIGSTKIRKSKEKNQSTSNVESLNIYVNILDRGNKIHAAINKSNCGS